MVRVLPAPLGPLGSRHSQGAASFPWVPWAVDMVRVLPASPGFLELLWLPCLLGASCPLTQDTSLELWPRTTLAMS